MADFFEIRKNQIIRSSFCALDVMGGTRLGLFEDGDKFLVASRFQNIGRRKRIEDAIALFERTLIGQ
jgi:hypothetical protein